MNQLLHDDQSNWKLYIARIKHAYTQLANYNLKEEVDAKAVSVNSSYRSTWHEKDMAKQKKKHRR